MSRGTIRNALGAGRLLGNNPWVITGKTPGAHLTDLHPPRRRIRERAGIEDVRIHDLRHTFASTAVAAGQGLPMIGKLLGHSQVQTTARYAHLAADPVKVAAEQVSTRLEAMLDSGPGHRNLKVVEVERTDDEVPEDGDQATAASSSSAAVLLFTS